MKTKMLPFFFLSSFFLLLSCHTIGKKSQVSIQNKTLEEYSVRYIDKFGDYKTMRIDYKAPLSIKGHFPNIFMTQHNHIERVVFVRPKNKNIAIITSGDSISYEGSGSREELVIFQEMHRRFSLFNGYTLGLNRRAWDMNYAYMSSKEIYEEETRVLKNFYEKYKVSRDVQEYLNQEIKYSYFCNLLGPYSIKAANVDSLSPAFVKTLMGLGKDLKTAIRTRKGNAHNLHTLVYDYNRFLCRKEMLTDKAFEAQWASAQKNFKRETREYLKFRLLREYFGLLKNYDTYWQSFKKKSKDPDFVQYLEAFFEENKHTFSQFELYSEVEDTTGKTLTWLQVLAENKGKKVYLVLANNSFLTYTLNPITAKVADFTQKNCVIIALSDDEKKENWLKNLPQKNMNHVQFYRISDLKSPLSAYFDSNPNKSQLNRSFLLNKNGQVILTKLKETSKMALLLKQLDFEGF